jgi:hypothetical protein
MDSKQTEFLQVCVSGDVERVKQLLGEGVDINTRNQVCVLLSMCCCVNHFPLDAVVGEFLLIHHFTFLTVPMSLILHPQQENRFRRLCIELTYFELLDPETESPESGSDYTNPEMNRNRSEISTTFLNELGLRS